MAFDLDITITGISMFVPLSQPAPVTHLLFPNTRSICVSANDVPPHDVQLICDWQFVVGGAAGSHDPDRRINLFRRAIDIGSLGAVQGQPDFPSIMPNMADLVAGPLKPRALEMRPPEEVAARFTLPRGCVTQYEPGATWKLANAVRRMSFSLTWTARQIEGDCLTLRVLNIDDESTVETLELQPVAGRIEFVLNHLPPKRAGAHVHEVDPGGHFRAYYCSFDERTPGPTPTLTNNPLGVRMIRGSCNGAFTEAPPTMSSIHSMSPGMGPGPLGEDFKCMMSLYQT
jgi:hypothetical protein